MKRLISAIEFVNSAMGKTAAWCALAMMCFQMISVLLRYVFSYGLITFQEAVIYCHAALFMLGAAYVLQLNEHVRVDIIYASLSRAAKGIVDRIALAFFVLPVACVIGWYGLPYVVNSWATLEGSRQAGGIPAIFLLKSTIVAFALSLALQAVAILLRLYSGQTDHRWHAPAGNDGNGQE